MDGENAEVVVGLELSSISNFFSLLSIPDAKSSDLGGGGARQRGRGWCACVPLLPLEARASAGQGQPGPASSGSKRHSCARAASYVWQAGWKSNPGLESVRLKTNTRSLINFRRAICALSKHARSYNLTDRTPPWI